MKTGIVRLITAGIALALLGALLVHAPTMAAPGDVLEKSCELSGGSELCQGRNQKLFGGGSVFLNIINVILGVAGAIAVVMIVIGGIRYIVSGGDQGAITSAKNTILYAVVGLIVAMLAFTIVNFVISSF